MEAVADLMNGLSLANTLLSNPLQQEVPYAVKASVDVGAFLPNIPVQKSGVVNLTTGAIQLSISLHCITKTPDISLSGFNDAMSRILPEKWRHFPSCMYSNKFVLGSSFLFTEGIVHFDSVLHAK